MRQVPVVLLALLALCASAASAAEENAPAPVPPKRARARAMAAIREVYGKELQSSDARTQAQLADLLLKQAEDESASAAMRYVCLQQAFEGKLKADRHAEALEIARTVSQRYRSSGLAMEMRALVAIWRAARKRHEYAAAARGFATLATRAIKRNRFELADEALTNLYGAARGARDPGILKQAGALRKIIKPYLRLAEDARRARRTLAASPNNIEAHQTLGEYLCFVLGDWEQGLPHLVKGSQAKLAGLARADLTDPATLKEQRSLADAWYEMGTGAETDIATAGLLARAIHWYEQVLPEADGLLETKVALRLKQARKARREALPKLRGAVPAGARLFLTFDADTVLRRNNITAVRDRSKADRFGLLHNVKLPEGVFGQAAAFDGKSSYVTFKPEAGPLHKTTELTIACWVRTKSAGGWIIAQRQPGPIDGEYLFGLDGEGRPYYWDYNGGYGIRAAATKTVTDGKWHHVAFVRKGGQYGFYIDGKLAGKGTGTSKEILKLTLAMGCDFRGKHGFYAGLVDEMLLYARALSAKEVRQAYRAVTPQR
jgi:hypothetical protein